MTLGAFVTSNLLFKGLVAGLITALVAMGIVLVYRSSRVINFAVGNLGVPATARGDSPVVQGAPGDRARGDDRCRAAV